MSPTTLLLVAVLAPAPAAGAPRAQHTEHHHQVEKDGDVAMGFSHEKTTHHFWLHADGGAIQVDADSEADADSRERIQSHLAHIAVRFAEGDFALPMQVHSVTPPGADTMSRLRARIHYTYEPSPTGGRVQIRTDDPEALAAIHDFLRFQITDHQTGDPLEVTEPDKTECSSS